MKAARLAGTDVPFPPLSFGWQIVENACAPCSWGHACPSVCPFLHELPRCTAGPFVANLCGFRGPMAYCLSHPECISAHAFSWCLIPLLTPVLLCLQGFLTSVDT